jgi:hypothetical protein
MSAGPIDEKVVFNIARRIDGREARADYLQQVCGADPEALRRVRELLQVHEQEQSFLMKTDDNYASTLILSIDGRSAADTM